MFPDLFKDFDLYTHEYMEGLPLKESPYGDITHNLADFMTHLYKQNIRTVEQYGRLYLPIAVAECPVCESRVDTKGEHPKWTCHACAQHGSLHKEVYLLELDDFVWTITESEAMDKPELVNALAENQKQVFALYRKMIKGEETADMDEKLGKLKEELDTMSARL